MDPIAIDVRALVQSNVASLYSHLVTRPTGRAVRLAIEAQMGERLADRRRPVLSIVDLTQVAILDFSCADEVVAKLLARYDRDDRPFNAFFVFRYEDPVHRETLETVLARQSIAAVTESPEGVFDLVGSLEPAERALWKELDDVGCARGETLARLRDRAQEPLLALMRRRLVLAFDDEREVCTLARLAGRLRGSLP